jgi:hypothetical protein
VATLFMKIKFAFSIQQEYWKLNYPEWDSLDMMQQAEIKNNFYTQIDHWVESCPFESCFTENGYPLMMITPRYDRMASIMQEKIQSGEHLLDAEYNAQLKESHHDDEE